MKSPFRPRKRSISKAPQRHGRNRLFSLPIKTKSIHISATAGSKAALEFRSVTQSVDEAIVISDANGNIIFWNAGAETIFGYAEKEILGKPLALLIPMQSSALRGGKLEQLLFSKASPIDSKTHELRGIRKDGQRFPAELSLLTWRFGDRAFFTTIIRDITDRKRLQKEILEISGREQQRIGQDLHDDLCQQLTAVTFLTEILEKKLSGKRSAEAADAREIHKLISAAIVQTRLLAKGLLPVELESHGLLSALDDMARNTEKLTKVACRVEGGKPPVQIRDGTVALHLYRIAQEALNNALKHARATQVVIKMTASGGQIHLAIADNGIGIPEGIQRKDGLGLSIMNSRAETINGTLQIRRGDKGGTVITCSLRAPAWPAGKKAPSSTERRTRPRNPPRDYHALLSHA
jgi:two-component system, LuxR family, sensor kinase FixL